ncbi:hypothetical protein EGW08_003904 [Elysia chlorotica]|uniref:C2H2-type domain-containing protein n=1 Tax=Elysia chlorotica TaxID=188477 RepID=A0A433U3G2_ELYCH|nr:hypothetical protein EGW08_003904 [Elysia chlorotica]
MEAGNRDKAAMEPQDMDIKMEDFVDVVYKCKFCPYTCTQSPDMGHHVRENHLQPHSSGGLQTQLLASISKTDTRALSVSASTVSTASTTLPAQRTSENSGAGHHQVSNGVTAIHSDDELAFPVQSQAFMDKSLTTVSFAPFAVPVSSVEPTNLSNTSTPDLTELINLVKPGAQNSRQALKTTGMGTGMSSVDTAPGHLSGPSDNHPSVPTVVNLGSQAMQSGETPLHEVPSIQIDTAGTPIFNSGLLAAGDVSQPYTVMAIQMPNLNSRSSNAVPQYIVSTPGSDPMNVPETGETKEFLLCGLCKLAFTTMEECQAHMQLEHRELMHDTGVSIGVQVGGAKRGRKRKSEQLKKIKEEPESADPDDVEWLPSVQDLNSNSLGEGRSRRKVKPPRALKEDYVFGKRTHRKVKGPSSDLGYKLSCPMMGCKAKLKTEEGLRIHMDCHNMEDTALTCKECHAPHDFWKNLRLHLWKKHKIDCDLLTCSKCNYKTDTRHKMSIHMEIHSDTKPYTCDVCGKGFRQVSQMKNHQVTHVKDNSKEVGQYWFNAKKCDVCDRVFANSKCLKKHKEVVHGNYKPYECTFCSHTTARKAMMELHMRTHTGEKPFKCDICKYSTGDHNSLRRHKMRHTGQKQYRCTQCPYTCIQSISLKQHMRHKHPGTTAGIFQCSRCPFRSINQTIYFAHMQDHKKGLIPDKLVHPRVELPKARKAPVRTQGGVARREIPVVSPLLLKHPQLHTVMPGESLSSFSAMPGGQAITGVSGESADSQAEVFNMQVTMLAGGDTQISADDMTRLSECPGLVQAGTTALQLIYDTLATLGGHTAASEGHSTLLTTQLPSGIHTAVLSSLQDGHTVHNITYHLPKCDSSAAAVSGSQASKADGHTTDEKSSAGPALDASELAEVTSTGSIVTDRCGENSSSIEILKSLPHMSVENSSNELVLVATETKLENAHLLPQDGCNEKTLRINDVIEGERLDGADSYVEKNIDGDALREMVTVINNNEVSFISVDLIQPQQTDS